MKKYIIKKGNKQIELTDYKEILRVTYGIKDQVVQPSVAVVLDQPTDIIKKTPGMIETDFYKIHVLDDLKLKVYDLDNQLVHEDQMIQLNEKQIEKMEKGQLDNYISRESEKFSIYHQKKYLNEVGFYGMGEKYGHLNFLNRETNHFATDVLGVSPIHTSVQREYHTAMPFYIGVNPSLTYGIYYDNTYKTHFDFNKSNQGIVFKADGGHLDYYLMTGQNVDSVVQSYSKITGKMPLPRRDFLGYQQCRWSYKSKAELMAVARRMYKEEIPCDVFYLDIDYMEDYKVFTTDPKAFSAFKDMVDELHEMGYKLVTIIDPGIKKESGYFVYEEGLKNDYYIKAPTGKPYIGEVWPGQSVFPDFMRKEVRSWWGKLHKNLTDLGVDGIWNDMNEIADFSTASKTLPLDTYHIDDQGQKRTQDEIHNIYGHLEAQSTYEGLKEITNLRPFVLTRSAFSGTQRYSALWTGDNASIWEHLEAAIPMMINLSLTGYQFIGADMGGFLEDSSGELLTRWVQFGMFTPLYRNHCALNFINQEPWCFGENYLKVIKEFIELRYQLTPHLYSLLRQSSETGRSLIKPLFYYDYDEEAIDINDQFIFGDSILVAPIYKPRTKKKMVYLPKGQWYDFFTDEKYAGGEYHMIDVTLDRFPMFVKAGSIIPMQEKRLNLNEGPQVIDLHVYQGEKATYELYLDDGKTFDYQNEKYSLMNIELDGDQVTMKTVNNGYKIPEINIIHHK